MTATKRSANQRAMLDRLKALQDRPWLVALLLAIAVQALFLVHLDQPSVIMFDEVHYLPAAQALLDRKSCLSISATITVFESMA